MSDIHSISHLYHSFVHINNDLTSAISNNCEKEAIANNTTFQEIENGKTAPFLNSEQALKDYGQCVYDATHISSKAQEQPQATTPSIGTESEKPNQGIGTTVNDILDGSKPKEEAKPQTDKEKCEANGGEYIKIHDKPQNDLFGSWDEICKI